MSLWVKWIHRWAVLKTLQLVTVWMWNGWKAVSNSSKSAPFVPAVFQLVNNVDACWLCQSWAVMDLPDDRFMRLKYSTEMILNYLYFVLTQRSNVLYCILKNQLCDTICACEFGGLYIDTHSTELLSYKVNAWDTFFLHLYVLTSQIFLNKPCNYYKGLQNNIFF